MQISDNFFDFFNFHSSQVKLVNHCESYVNFVGIVYQPQRNEYP